MSSRSRVGIPTSHFQPLRFWRTCECLESCEFCLARIFMVRIWYREQRGFQDSNSVALEFRSVSTWLLCVIGEPSTAMGSLRASISMPGAVVSSPRVAMRKESLSAVVPQAGENGGFATSKRGPLIAEIPLEYIRRPLLRTRNNDPQKVKELMESIAEIGLQEPIDVLEVEGVYYGFSGCHRYEAHQKLGLPTIKCKIRRGTRETLRHHLR